MAMKAVQQSSNIIHLDVDLLERAYFDFGTGFGK